MNQKEISISPKLQAWLDKQPRSSEKDYTELGKAIRDLDKDPEWRADYLKGLFVLRILEAMEESGRSQSQVAKKWGKSRQYLSKVLDEDKEVNFTIETMCDLAHLLDHRIEIAVLKENEMQFVVPIEKADEIKKILKQNVSNTKPLKKKIAPRKGTRSPLKSAENGLPTKIAA